MIEYQIEILKKLKESNSLTYDEILKITNALQIASGQSYAKGKTKGILEFLKKYGHIYIICFPKGREIELKTTDDLDSLFKNIDNYIDIKKDPNFIQYFQ